MLTDSKLKNDFLLATNEWLLSCKWQSPDEEEIWIFKSDNGEYVKSIGKNKKPFYSQITGTVYLCNSDNEKIFVQLPYELSRKNRTSFLFIGNEEYHLILYLTEMNLIPVIPTYPVRKQRLQLKAIRNKEV